MNSEDIFHPGAAEPRLPHPKPLKLTVLYVAYALLAVFFPTVIFTNVSGLLLEGLSLAAAIVGVYAYYSLVGVLRPAISYGIFIFACTLLGMPIAGLAAAFITPTLILAYTLAESASLKERIIPLAIPAAAFAVSAPIIGSPLLALSAVFHVFPALVLCYSLKKDLPRVSAICRSSAVILAPSVIIAAVIYIGEFGTDLSVLKTFADNMRETIVDYTASQFYELYNQMSEISLTDAEELSRSTVYAVFNLLPAILVVVVNLLSFALQSMLTNAYAYRHPTNKEKLKTLMLFEMSLVSSVVFLASAILSLFLTSEEYLLYGATAENIALILMPGMIYTAILMLRAFAFAKQGSCAGVLVYFGFIMLFFYFPPIIAALSSVGGAVIIILNAISVYKKGKKNNTSLK